MLKVDFRFVAIFVAVISMSGIIFASSNFPAQSAKVMELVSTGALYFGIACVATFAFFLGKLMFSFFKELIIK